MKGQERERAKSTLHRFRYLTAILAGLLLVLCATWGYVHVRMAVWTKVLVSSSSVERRVEATNAISDLGSCSLGWPMHSGTVSALREATADVDPRGRASALWALSLTRSAGAAKQEVLHCFNDENPDVARAAIKAAKAVGLADEEIRESLINLSTSSPIITVRQAATIVLEEVP